VDLLIGTNAFFVCHKPVPLNAFFGMQCEFIRNVGLEFGCYDWYLKNKWVGGPVLFLHDDNEITQEALDAIATIQQDQVFLFASEAEAEANGKAHGRAMFCSERFLNRLKTDSGFWYDEGPITSVAIPATSAEEPNYHNAGIQTFVAYLKSLPKEFSVNRVGILKGLKTGYRGRL
jgi:hypothetical protein